MKISERMTYDSRTLCDTVLRDRSFLSCTFQNCTFRNVDLEGCLFRDCVFTDCEICGLKGHDSLLRGCHIRRCRLSDNDWAKICPDPLSSVIRTMEDCTIEENRFCDQDFSGLQLFSCRILRCYFRQCTLRSVRFFSCRMSGTVFLHCDLSGTVLPSSEEENVSPG